MKIIFKKVFLIKWEKLLRIIMRTFLFLCFTTAFSFAPVDTFSQNAKIKIDNDITISVVQIFELIQQQAGYKFVYSDELFINAPMVELKKGIIRANELLKKGLSPIDCTFEFTNNETIIVKRNKRSVLKKIQQIRINGKVTDTNGQPLPGANILEKGTTNGTQTDFDGNFSLEVANENTTLVISFIGFITQEITVTDQTSITVVLEEDEASLDEVVIVGYSSQSKATVTGAISTMKAEDMKDLPVPNITQSMAGRVSGVFTRPNGGAPGNDDPDITIRGIVSTGNTQPLIVVDGVIRDNIRQINPKTIESVTILKDAAAVAPFGMGGANGVILITTKTGKLGKPIIRLSSSVGFQNPTYLPNMLNAQDYMALQNEGYYNNDADGTTPPNNPDLVNNYNALHAEDVYLYPDSEFTDLYNENLILQLYNLEISGATEDIKYLGGLGYYKQDGLFDNVGYERYTYNLSLEAKVTNTTKIKMSLIGSIEDTDGIDGDENLPHLFRSMYKFIPTQSLIYPGGDMWGESSGGTPVGVLNSNGYRKDEDNTLLSTISIDQELPFIKGLSIKGVFSYDPSTRYYKSFHVPFVYHVIDLEANPYTFTEAISLHEGSGQPYTWLELENRRAKRLTYQGFVNYKRYFGDHNVTGLFVAEARKTSTDFFRTRRNNFAIEIDELSLGSSNKLDYDNAGSSGSGSQIGYVYRAGYTYKNKYMFEASGRYDGHYSFAPDHRWGYFPAFSAGWRVSEEKFMKNITSINRLKIRSSWGKSGNLPYINGNLADYEYLDGYDLRGNAYAFGNSNLVQGSRISQEANPDITWEISTKFDVGLELGLWNGLLNIEFDYFSEVRTDMLLAPQVILPVEYGLNLSLENKGEMDNRGFEFSISSNKQFDNGLSLNIGANFSYAENHMVEVFQTDAQKNNPNRNLVGKPLGTPFGYKSLGLFSTDDDINNDGIINSEDGYDVQQFGELHPGDVRYADLSGPDGVPDGKIDVNDETVIGSPIYPGILYGINTALEYKGFDFSVFFQGASKSSFNMRNFLTIPFENNGSNTSYEYFDNRWTVDNQDAKYPRSTTAPYSNNNQNSDFWMVNTSYLRLKNAVIGYTLPLKGNNDSEKNPSMRIYVIGQNIFTISNVDHVDPELGYSSAERAYPVMKSFSLGIDFSF